MEADEEEFDFPQWCADHKINQNTAEILEKEELITIECLVLLNEVDLKELGLTMGQRKLLNKAIDGLKRRYTDSSPPSFSDAVMTLSSGQYWEASTSQGMCSATSQDCQLGNETKIDLLDLIELFNDAGLDGTTIVARFQREYGIHHPFELNSFSDLKKLKGICKSKDEIARLEGLIVRLSKHNAALNTATNYKTKWDHNLRFLIANDEPDISNITVTQSMVDISKTLKSIMEMLNVNQSYPQKLTTLDILSLADAPDDKFCRTNVAKTYITNLVRLKHEVRDNFSHILPANLVVQSEKAGQKSLETSFLTKSDTNNIHPQDLLLIIILCSDNFLRQLIMYKLNICRLALPIVFKNCARDKLELAVWSLRAVILQWRDSKGKSYEMAAPDATSLILGFCKMGDNLTISKSSVLNMLLNRREHHTFHSRDCQKVLSRPLISGGVIEAAWYLPDNKPADSFPDLTVLLNMRGNALLYPKETKTLISIAHVLVVFVDIDVLHSEIDTILKMKPTNQPMIFMICKSCDTIKAERYIGRQLQLIESNLSSENNAYHLLAFSVEGDKTLCALETDLREKLRSIELPSSQRLSTAIQNGQQEMNGFECDETQALECTRASQVASGIFASIGETNLHEAKKLHLPLQQDWCEWSVLQKKKRRAKGRDEENFTLVELEELSVKMDNIRLIQRNNYAGDQSALIQTFIHGISSLCKVNSPQPEVWYLLQKLRMDLDAMSRTELPNLRQQYQDEWNTYQISKTKSDAKENLTMSAIQLSEKKLSDASFGLEHFVREIGQVYEAFCSCEEGLQVPQTVETVTNIWASLVIGGLPIELMDGDASNIPLTWLKTIFTRIADKTFGKRVYVISVLGIQSSGKSTLLNTMFGLQFAVSAGRCTRGVYMQMVPVDRKTSCLPFDYVLVIDSEGLRAPEKSYDKVDRDNEIATFVIGLGDVTIINVKGETYGEMKDVLQIAVHAFLRMKLVSSYTRKYHRCLFVHQNVPAIDADEHLNLNCHKLKDFLDEMTMEAAKQQNIQNVSKFQDIIDFDYTSHASFFPDLWHGEPPMAHVSKGYVEKVELVRQMILFGLPKRQKTYLSLMDIYDRIENLWDAIISDDFVFGFRNSLEVKLYDSLEKTMIVMKLELEENMNNWIEETVINTIDSCVDKGKVDNCKEYLSKDMKDKLSNVTSKVTKELDDHFLQSPYHDIIVQWEHHARKYISESSRQCEENILGQIDSLARQRCEKIDISRKSMRVRRDIQRLVKLQKDKPMLVPESNSTHSSLNLEATFQQIWYRREPRVTNELEINHDEIDRNVKECIERVFVWSRSSQSTFVKSEFKKNQLTRGSSKLGPGKKVWTDLPKDYISISKPDLKRQNTDLHSKSGYSLQSKQLVLEAVNGLLERIYIYLENNVETVNRPFQETHVSKLLTMIHAVTETAYTCANRRVTITNKFSSKIKVEVAKYAYDIFYKSEINHQSKTQIDRQEQENRGECYRMYLQGLGHTCIEDRAVDLFTEDIQSNTIIYIMCRAQRRIIIDINTHFQTKDALMRSLLKWLADRNVKGIFQYIDDPRVSARSFLDDYICQVWFGQNPSQKGKFFDQCISRLNNIFKHLESCITASNAYDSLLVWAKQISVSFKCPLISMAKLQSDDQINIGDFNYFIDKLRSEIATIKDNVKQHFLEITFETVKWEGMHPRSKALQSIWGCNECCPFCREPCMRSDRKHLEKGIKHTCIQHRPLGLSGWHWKDTGILWAESCSFYAASKRIYPCQPATCVHHDECVERDIKFHKFRNLKVDLPTWDIPPDNGLRACTYWVWVFNTCAHQLAKRHGLNDPEMPQTMSRITKKSAIESIETDFHV